MYCDFEGFEVLTDSSKKVHVDYFGESVASGCFDTPCVHVVMIFRIVLYVVFFVRHDNGANLK